MRALLVTKEFSPTPTSGGMLRTLALLQQLATQYRTTVISPDGVFVAGPGTEVHRVPSGPPAEGPLRRLASAGRYRSISGVRTAGPRLLANLRRVEGRYDVGVIDHTCLAGLADGVAADCDRLVVSMHNVESDLMVQRTDTAGPARLRPAALAMRAETRLLRRLEARVGARYPMLVCTEADALALPARAGVIVCRNGVFPAEPIRPDSITDARPEPAAFSMVFSGALDWEPNLTGLLWFARRVWPLIIARIPQAGVTVAGRNPGPEVTEVCARAGIRLLADPPRMAPVLAAHRLGIVPLLSGGGSRIKILEYLAAGIDIVSTDVGASGLEDIPERLIDRVPVDPQAFADRVVSRLRAPGGHGAQAQGWVRENYSWDVTLAPLLDHLQR